MPEQDNPLSGQWPSPARTRLTTLRWLTVALLMVAELAGARFFLAFPDISTQPRPVAQLIRSVNEHISVGSVGSFIIAFLATLLLIISTRLESVARDLLNQDGYRWWPWLAGHATSFMLFIGISWPVFGPAATISGLSTGWLAGWIATGTVMLICLFLTAAPASTWLRLAHQERIAAAMAAIAGSIAWAGGQLTQELWTPLTDVTLWCSYNLLSVLYADVFIDPTRAILGVNSFLVEIASACSGLEGIALITVFTTLYLWLFRKELRFPAALLLFPVGITIIWITNILRIVILISVGAFISPDIAVDGFHSQAGWIGFTIVAFAVIFLAHRHFLAIAPDTATAHSLPPADTSSAPSLLMPLLALLASSMLVAASSSGFTLLYPVNVIVTAGVLWHFRGRYKPLMRIPSWHAVAIGIAVGVIWLWLVPDNNSSGSKLATTLTNMPTWLSAGWIAFRILGSVFTVPIAEELAFRGYLLHRLVATDFEHIKPGSFTWLSFLLSSVLFGLMHGNWLAGTLAGAGFALALYRRGQLGDAIVAHITSNALVAVAVLGAGQWELWG